MQVPGVGPAAEVLLFRQKDPKPLTPRSASLDWADAGKRAGQLARPALSFVEGLRQGPPRKRASPHGAERQAWENDRNRDYRKIHSTRKVRRLVRNPSDDTQEPPSPLLRRIPP
jgi:hypothetical protein